MTEAAAFDDHTSIRRLVALVLELGTEASERGRKGGGRSFAKTEILLHAMAVFNQRGLEETAVQDLLEAASISRRTFYKYFSSKLDVLENIYALSLRILLARFESDLPVAQSKEELIVATLKISFDYQFTLGRIIGLMMEEAARSASPLARHRQQLHRGIMAILTRELQRLGEPAPEPYLVTGLLMAVEGLSLQILTQTSEAERPQAISACRQQLRILWERALA